ncbi:hypothetical protein ACFYTS_00035 [Nocardia sp. NPDC004151]|uniref:hypothetical protein n=1 Tax=Nocardia sp. NPDC004151 TaxID=3364304 RepID=UPI0036A711AF
MITYLADYETSLVWEWVLAMVVPSIALIRLALWSDRMPPQNSVGAIRARIERERRAAAADPIRRRPVTDTRAARRPVHRRSAA